MQAYRLTLIVEVTVTAANGEAAAEMAAAEVKYQLDKNASSMEAEVLADYESMTPDFKAVALTVEVAR